MNKFLSEFLIMVHKKEDNEEHEPAGETTLPNFHRAAVLRIP